MNSRHFNFETGIGTDIVGKVEAFRDWDGNITWSFNTVKMETVALLNPETAKTISELAQFEAQRLDTLEEAERVKREEEIKIKLDAEKIEFDNKVKLIITATEAELLTGGFTYTIHGKNHLSFTKDEVDCGIDYDSYGAHSLPWKVTINLRSTRSGSLEKAIRNGMKKVIEKIAVDEVKKLADKLEKEEQANLANTLKESGIVFSVSRESYNKGNNKYEYYNVEKAHVMIQPKTENDYDQIYVVGNIYRNKENVIINHVNIKGKFTAEQFKKLADFIKELNIIKEY